MGRATTTIQSLALVRLSALGDVTLLVPVIRSLQAALPNARLTWIIGRGAHELVRDLPGVEFIVLDKDHGLAGYLALRRYLSGRRFDVLLALQASLRANLIYPLIRAPVKVGFDRARARDAQWLFTNARIREAREHLLDSFFAFIEYLGVTERVLQWDLPITAADREWARAQLPAHDGPLLAINPCASKSERDWLPQHFATVVRAAQERWRAHVVLTGAPGAREQAVGASIAAAAPNAVTNLIGRTTPKRLAAVLEAADCLLAPDTGPVHMAVAMGTPVVGLYAVAPAQLSGPYGGRHLVIDKYAEAVRGILRRDPATVSWRTRVHRGNPMALIEPSEVLEKLSQVFAP
jgi:heptosyltransferase I